MASMILCMMHLTMRRSSASADTLKYLRVTNTPTLPRPALDPTVADKLLQQAPDALLLADERGRILFANAAATELFGYGYESLLGESIDSLLPERYRRAHETHRRHFAETPSHRTMGQRGVPLFGRRHDGSEFPIWVSLSPIKVGNELQIAAAIRDVTDWEQLTQHLRLASEAAEKASQTKSRFLATASHDLRQPLQALQLLNTSLARKLKGRDAQALVARQQHAIDSMTELLNALLDISKLESGTVAVKLEPVNTHSLMEEIRDQFESLIASKSLNLNLHIADLNLLTDRVLFKQMVQNLVGNAIKYTEQGAITVTLVHDLQQTTLEITDSGVGIPRDQLAKIFDAYYQPHAARPDRPGVGLGLAIVKQITELLGFGIQVESQPGRGTSFRVHIPNERITSAAPAPQKAALATQKVQISGQCVLVIEDDHAVREAIALALELEGFAPLTAADAHNAASVFKQHIDAIAAVVSDYHVDTSHTGVDIVKSLRALRAAPLPAVFLTGDTSLATKAQQDLPNTRLLSKPVDINHLVQALGALL
jgi:two-component system, sensor histidine kinase